MSEHYYNHEKGEYDPPYFKNIVWSNLMLKGSFYHSIGSPAHYEKRDLWHSDVGYAMKHNQNMSAEYYRAARKMMGIE